MLFSYAVRSVYIESCSLFVRGGVYRVVKEAMGGFLAKLSVSALMFDYILTGPISGVSAGQYIMGLLLDTLAHRRSRTCSSTPDAADAVRRWGAVVDRLRDHALLLPPEPAGHSRVERQGPEDHDRHHGDGGGHAGLVRRDAVRSRRPGEPRADGSPTWRRRSSSNTFFGGGGGGAGRCLKNFSCITC